MTGTYFVTVKSPCPECDGTGHVPRHDGTPGALCLLCDGTGALRMEASLADALRTLGIDTGKASGIRACGELVKGKAL